MRILGSCYDIIIFRNDTEYYCFYLVLVLLRALNPFICLSDHQRFCHLIHALLPTAWHGTIYRHRFVPTNQHFSSHSSKQNLRERTVSRREKPKPTPSKLIKRFVGRIVWGIVTQTRRQTKQRLSAPALYQQSAYVRTRSTDSAQSSHSSDTN